MAAAQEAKDKAQAAQVVPSITPGLDNLVKAAAGAVQERQASAGERAGY